MNTANKMVKPKKIYVYRQDDDKKYASDNVKKCYCIQEEGEELFAPTKKFISLIGLYHNVEDYLKKGYSIKIDLPPEFWRWAYCLTGSLPYPLEDKVGIKIKEMKRKISLTHLPA
jgi:hypothetical protein